jgi:omega-6 fatty acid desaturase (delta-12 desaturase)
MSGATKKSKQSQSEGGFPEGQDAGLCGLPPVTFTLESLRKSIPAHCFKRSLLVSVAHTIKDVILCLGAWYVSTYFEQVPAFAAHFPGDDTKSTLIRASLEYSGFVLWPIYWFFQGLFMTGLWVVGHECGHQAFSDYKSVNDFFGIIIHSFLLVPYHSWRISHANHHLNTNSLENDEVFVPVRSEKANEENHKDEDQLPLVTVINVINMLVFGWPLYLIANATGPNKYKKKLADGTYSSMNLLANHFSPNSPLFRSKDAFDIIISDVVLFSWIGGLVYLTHQHGVWTMFKYYGAPELWVNAWLVLITFLHHTAEYMPRMDAKRWNWLEGALCTVDRSYGWFIDACLHHITDTHVCHHIFSKMPWYHAEEATECLKSVLGPYYFKDDEWFFSAVIHTYNACHVLPTDKEGMIYFPAAKKYVHKKKSM